MDKNIIANCNNKSKSIVITMKSKNLKENFGTQSPSFAGGGGSNFSIGADLGAHSKGSLGTRGADSKFSQRMQAIIPNDYYDLLEEEDEEEIDESYFVESSRYSLKDLNLFEARTRPVLKPSDHQFWIKRIEKSIKAIDNNEIKKQIETLFKNTEDDFSGNSPISYWTSFIAQLNLNILKNDPVTQNLFNKTLSLDDELMRNIIFQYAEDLIKNKNKNENVTVGNNSQFPHVKIEVYVSLTKKIIEHFLTISPSKLKETAKSMIERHFSSNFSHFKKILLISAKGESKTLYDKVVEDNVREIIKKVTVTANANKTASTASTPPLPSPSTSSRSAPPEPVPPPEPKPAVPPELDLDLDIPQDDNVSDTSPNDDSEGEDSSEDQASPRPGTPPTPASRSGAASPPRPSSKPSEEHPFDELVKDPMFDNPFVKLFVKRAKDRQVNLTDFYKYFKNKKAKTNESFDLSLNQKSLSYLIEEGFLDDLTDIGTDVVGDLGAAAASAGTFGVTSAAFILKNLYELQETSKKADIAIEAFLLNPSDKTCENIEKILSDIITDFIDLVQRTIEVIPEPSGDLATALASVGINAKKIYNFLKSLFVTQGYLSKIKNLGKMHLILKPFIKIILSILDSEQTPEEIKNDKRFILGTLNKMILIIDLTEDFYIQKRAAETAGIKDFQYKNKIFQKSRSFDDYDPQTSHARKSPEQREREYLSDYDDGFSFLQDSLKRKSLAYLIAESEEDIVDEEVEAEGEELEEFSGAGAVAGFTLPLGASPRGPKGAHSSTTGGKAYPYTSSNRSKFNKFSKKTFGGK